MMGHMNDRHMGMMGGGTACCNGDSQMMGNWWDNQNLSKDDMNQHMQMMGAAHGHATANDGSNDDAPESWSSGHYKETLMHFTLNGLIEYLFSAFAHSALTRAAKPKEPLNKTQNIARRSPFFDTRNFLQNAIGFWSFLSGFRPKIGPCRGQFLTFGRIAPAANASFQKILVSAPKTKASLRFYRYHDIELS